MSTDRSIVTILDLALHRGVVESPEGRISGGEFERVGLPIMGGCEVCGATIGAYNAAPSKTGYLRCSNDCIADQGWTDVAAANEALFVSVATAAAIDSMTFGGQE